VPPPWPLLTVRSSRRRPRCWWVNVRSA
jgi:hypothetical protein